MRVFSRLKTGLVLSVASLRVLRAHPKLALYPLISGVASIVFVAALLVPLFVVSGSSFGPVEMAVLFVIYLGSTYIAALFNAGLVYSVDQVFHGNEPSIREGLGAASNRSGTLLVWAFVSAVVGILIQALESRGQVGAQLVATIFSVGWTLTTFFVIPVIVFEDTTPKSMFTKSASIFTETWGETAGANVGLGLVPIAIAIAGGLLAVAVAVAVPTTATFVAAAVIGILAVVTSMLVGGVITGVAKTALYVYATDDIQPEEFRQFDFDSLFERDGDGAPSSSRGPGGMLRQKNRI